MSTRRATHFRKNPSRPNGPRGGGEFGSGQRSGGANYNSRMKTVSVGALLSTEATNKDEMAERTKLAHEIDEKMGFPRYESGPKKEGWLVNMQSVCLRSGGGGMGGELGVDAGIGMVRVLTVV